MNKETFSINQIKKYLKKKGFTINKKINDKKEINVESLARTFLSSLIIISIFFITPLVMNFTLFLVYVIL